MHKLDFHNVCYNSSDNKKIIKDVDFNLDAGNILCVIGPSGSGKSTLLRLINRLSEVSSGTISIDNQDIKSMDIVSLRRKVGIVFQNPRLFSGTVEDNILYGPRLAGNSEGLDAIKYLELSGLNPDYLKRSIDKLSGGEQQRVSIARALANTPDILLLDEPTSALDPALTEQLEKTFIHLQDKLGLTIIWVTHNLEQAARVSNNILLLIEGSVAEFSETGAFFRNPSGEAAIRFLNTK